MAKRLSEGLNLSIGSDSIPMTMRAEIGHMSIEEAVASRLFDLPDEPGMVRIPVTRPASDAAPDETARAAVPPQRKAARTRGNAPTMYRPT
ncbi:hypothetical protein [Lichenicoccus sp.]|uniref:hypothetical protein n=1 Tax=Lichenicoccus sp. TaxID=2781899 RepID=UPI003D0AA389